MRKLKFGYSRQGLIASFIVFLLGLIAIYTSSTCELSEGPWCGIIEVIPLLLPVYFFFQILFLLLSPIFFIFQISLSQISFLDYDSLVLHNMIIWEIIMLTLYVVLTYKFFSRKIK